MINIDYVFMFNTIMLYIRLFFLQAISKLIDAIKKKLETEEKDILKVSNFNFIKFML